MKKVLTYFQYLNDQYGIHVTIKDFAHIIFKNRYFAELKQFESHSNSFCMYVKSFDEARLHCEETSNIQLYTKISSSKDPHEPFWGICYCGVREYVIPIVSQNFILGAILVGQFSCDRKRRISTFEKVVDKYDFNLTQLDILYEKNFANFTQPHDAILAVLQICADYIASYMSNLLDFEKMTSSGRNQLLINNAITYIHSNIREGKITLTDIAQHCHCSESTLSHCFRKSMGISVGNYILHRRISKAERLLLESELSISMIAIKCGFGSSEHFSSTFKKYKQFSPANYRQRLHEKSNENM